MGQRLPVDGDHADDDSVPDVESVIFVREMIGSIIYNVILRICMVNGRPRRGLWTALKKLDVLLSKKQPYGKIKILFKIKLAVVRHSIEQTLGFAGDPFGRMAQPIDQQSMADTVSGKGWPETPEKSNSRLVKQPFPPNSKRRGLLQCQQS